MITLASTLTAQPSQPAKQKKPAQGQNRATSQNQSNSQPPIQITVTTPDKSPTEKQDERDRADRQDRTNARIAYFTFWLVIVGGISAVLVFAGLLYTARAANAAKKSANVAREALVSIQRPFVSVNPRWFWHEGVPLQPGVFTYSVEPVLENAGPVPTRDCNFLVAYSLRETPLPDDFDFALQGAPGTVTIGAHSSAVGFRGWIGAEDVSRVQQGTRHFYTWGVVTYRDQFVDTPAHTTRFCFYLTNIFGNANDPAGSHLSMRFWFHDRHNDAD
jgi:hypothetical protein